MPTDRGEAIRAALATVLLLSAVAIIVYFLPRTANARWDATYASHSAEVQAWFKTRHNSKGEWCCDEGDGHRYDGDYEMKSDRSVVIYGSPLGQEHRIPADLVLRGSNPTGSAVWWYRDFASGHRDYCFAPGSAS